MKYTVAGWTIGLNILRTAHAYLCNAMTLLRRIPSFLVKRLKFSHDCFQSMSKLHTVCFLSPFFADISAVCPSPIHVGFMMDKTLGQIILRLLPVNLVSPSFHQCSVPISFICCRLCMTVSYTGRAFYYVSEHDGFYRRFIA